MKSLPMLTVAAGLFAAFASAQVPRFRAINPSGSGASSESINAVVPDPYSHTAQGAARLIPLEPSTHGNPEGIAYDPANSAFFVGATGDGTIYRGTLDSPTAAVFIAGSPGLEAVGLKVVGGKLYVAGGFSGSVRVYDIAAKTLLASFDTGGGGMLNDLAVTTAGDVFVTDSFRPTLWRISAAKIAAGGGTPDAIPLDPEISYGYSPDPFNLNGIVALNGGRRLIVGQSNTGKLFRIDLNEAAPLGREIREISIEPVFSDGLLMDKGYLVAVTFAPEESLTFIRLDGPVEQGRVVDRLRYPALRGPSTVARARNSYLVVNADFATGTIPFTVACLPRSGDEDEPQ